MIYRTQILKIYLSKLCNASKDSIFNLIAMRPLNKQSEQNWEFRTVGKNLKLLFFYLMLLGCCITTPMTCYYWMTNWTLSVMFCKSYFLLKKKNLYQPSFTLIFAMLLHEMGPWRPTKENAQFIRPNDFSFT